MTESSNKSDEPGPSVVEPVHSRDDLVTTCECGHHMYDHAMRMITPKCGKCLCRRYRPEGGKMFRNPVPSVVEPTPFTVAQGPNGSWHWRCEECGWVGLDLSSHDLAKAEAVRHAGRACPSVVEPSLCKHHVGAENCAICSPLVPSVVEPQQCLKCGEDVADHPTQWGCVTVEVAVVEPVVPATQPCEKRSNCVKTGEHEYCVAEFDDSLDPYLATQPEATKCPKCKGNARSPANLHSCSRCLGYGEIPTAPEDSTTTTTCPGCGETPCNCVDRDVPVPPTHLALPWEVISEDDYPRPAVIVERRGRRTVMEFPEYEGREMTSEATDWMREDRELAEYIVALVNAGWNA